MSRWLRDLRLIPVVLIAAGGLFALKAAGLMLEGGFSLGQRLNRGESIVVTTVPAPPPTQLRSQTVPLSVASSNPSGRSWAQEMFNYPDITGSVAGRAPPKDAVIVTGSVGSTKEPPKEPAKETGKPPAKDAPKDAAKDASKDGKPAAKDAKAEPPQTKPAAGSEKPVDLARPDPSRVASQAERAILERLVERRQELEARAREIELRENLLKAAEKNLEAKLATIKEQESRASGTDRKDPVEAARFKSLITMYESMKAKEAAKIFDRLDLKVLVEVASQINPRRMSEILAQMTPEAAEKLTVEFAARGGDTAPKTPDLPKIDGKPTGS